MKSAKECADGFYGNANAVGTITFVMFWFGWIPGFDLYDWV